MWMSNYCVPLKNVESPYGGGVSPVLGAAGGPHPAMFPVTPALLAEGPQLGPWQVAVVRVDETPAGDSSGQDSPCVTQNRHRPMDIYELPDSLAHTIVEGGPVGPEVKEPLALLVLDHTDPAGQHAVTQNTTSLLEHLFAQPEPSLGGGLVGRISDGEPTACQVPDITLDSRFKEGITYLEHPALGVSLDSGPMEGTLCLEPFGECGGCVDSSLHPPCAVCYDCVCLMLLIRITMPLSSDGDGTVNRNGYDRDYDGSPAGLLGCLPQRLCLLWAMDGMTQLQTKINGPYSDILLRKTMNDGGRQCVWISDTPPATHAGKGSSLTLIGRRASVGGSAGLTDWPCVLGAVDNPPSGFWIDFIRRTMEDSQSIVAMPVSGSLVSPTLFSGRDADCTYRSLIFCVNCDKDWIVPAGYQVLLLEYAEGRTMEADGFSIVDNRAGVTSGVELYVPWDAPEMAIDLSSTGTVLLRNVPDVFGMSGVVATARRRVTFCKGGMPVVFEYLFRTAVVWTRTFMM